MEEKVVIQITPQRRGLNFALHPRTQQRLNELPEADPSRANIFIGFEEKEAFDQFAIDTFENQVIILLTGLTAERLLEEFDAIEFQRMPSGNTEHTIRL